MSKEGAREREMHRYYQPWLETFLSDDFEPAPTLPPDNHHLPRSSNDKALTAFAQLGCLRLNAKRSTVNLLGITRQFILAEATKTLSLMSDKTHDGGDQLWFGNSYIEREAGISGETLHAERYTAYDADGSAYTAPALVINDISKHDTYSSRGYAGHGVSFYCGVPITTDHGLPIGVYSVTDDSPRDHLTATELCFLVDMSAIVMQHLEVVRNDRARKRGERLIHGLGGFIEGAASGYPSQPRYSSQVDGQPKQIAGSGSTAISDTQDADDKGSSKNAAFLGMTIQDANTPSQESKAMAVTSHDRSEDRSRKRTVDFKKQTTNDEDYIKQLAIREATDTRNGVVQDSHRVFARAAAILRYCLGADGVMFFNASSANLSSGSRMETSGGTVSKVHHSRPTRKRRTAQSEETQTEGQHTFNSAEESSHSSDDDSGDVHTHSDSSNTRRKKQQRCQVLGLSMADQDKTVILQEQALRRLVRRHPKGKCFTYDKYGNPASSDEGSASEASELLSNTDDANQNSDSALRPLKYIHSTSSLLKALPGARSIVFLPLWDTGKERWHSGLVIWSYDPGSLANVDDNMIYLKAFSNAILNEVNRLDLVLSDTAKSTFLANISHELRSPLHGILGSIEFLHDTAMDDFQSSMVISVETCGKTLLDTVNHVLDYSKINNLSRSHRRNKGSPDNGDRPETSLTEDFNMAIVVEEAVEAAYAGQVFRSANSDALEGKSPLQTSASRAMQQRHERKANISIGAAQQKSPVRLTLNIDDYTRWLVRSQPGAVRRIVMNILGNALKYTTKGSINVSLEVDRSRNKSSSNLHMMLQVADTGQGMSDDFMKNHAFTAFSQENSLATGIGLGLSIVRQIVDSLGGKIDLWSEKEVGTDVRIWLSLPKSKKDESEDYEKNPIPEVRERTTGREMCMLMPEKEHNAGNSVGSLVPMPSIESSMRNLVTQWFEMKVVTKKSMDGQSPDFFVYPEPPPIDYLMDFHGTTDSEKEIPVIILCTNAFEAASLRSNGIYYLTDIGRVIEIIAQPCGPQKLAKVLHRCMQRLLILEKDQSKRKSSSNVALAFGLKNSDADAGRSVGDDAKEQPKADAATVQGDVHEGQSTGPEQDHSPAPNPPQDGPIKDKFWISAKNPVSEQTEGETLKKRKSLQNSGSSSQGTATIPTTNGTDSEDLPETPMADRPRVLVVDDNHINLHLLVTFVRKSGHPYESATDGLKALQAYQKSVNDDRFPHNPIRYILMDISMPVMNGMTATKEIRKFEREKGVREPATIIALTGMGSELAQTEAKDAGFNQFLSKPIKFRDLVKLLI